MKQARQIHGIQPPAAMRDSPDDATCWSPAAGFELGAQGKHVSPYLPAVRFRRALARLAPQRLDQTWMADIATGAIEESIEESALFGRQRNALRAVWSAECIPLVNQARPPIAGRSRVKAGLSEGLAAAGAHET